MSLGFFIAKTNVLPRLYFLMPKTEVIIEGYGAGHTQIETERLTYLLLSYPSSIIHIIFVIHFILIKIWENKFVE